VSPKTRQTSTPTPTWKIAWAALCTVTIFIRAHLTAVVVCLAGVCTGAAAVIHYSAPVYHAITSPNAKRDADISANAAGLAALATQVNTWHAEEVKGAGDTNAAIAAVTTQIGNLAAQQQVTNTNLAVQTIRLTDVIAGQEETNKRLDTITSILMRQAMGKPGPEDLPPASGHFATSTAGSTLPPGVQQ
jgi:hypothetical protein